MSQIHRFTVLDSEVRMGRPGTPGPGEGGRGGGGGGGGGKATLSGAMVLLGIVSFVMGVIAVAVPYWGHFRPGGGEGTLAFIFH